MDYKRVIELSQVLEATRQLPKLGSLHNAAMKELQDINDSIQLEKRDPNVLGGMPTGPSPATAVAPIQPTEPDADAERKALAKENQQRYHNEYQTNKERSMTEIPPRPLSVPEDSKVTPEPVERKV